MQQSANHGEEKSQDLKETRSSIGNYSLGKTIGVGTFGKVKIGTHKLTNENVAVKILEKERITQIADIERVARQIHILKLTRHPHIIQLYEIIETPNVIYMIMEYCAGGQLFDFIVAEGRVQEDLSRRFVQQILAGVEYIHRLNIVHRDLKPENLLLDKAKQVLKIADFGLSNTYKQEELLKTACGSPCYAAPEMIAGNKYSGLEVDLWSLGVILFALLCGYLPFEDQNTAVLYKKILAGKFKVPRFVGDSARDLIQKLLVVKPEDRIKVADIKTHPWFLGKETTRTIPSADQGLMVGYNHIPIDLAVLKELEGFGVDCKLAEKCVDANMHTHESTAYFLLLNKKAKQAGLNEQWSAQPNETEKRGEQETSNSKESEKSVEILESKGGGSDPRNKRALDLHALQLFPSLTNSIDECLDLVDDRDITSETTTLYDGGDTAPAQETLMVAAKNIVSMKSTQEPSGASQVGSRRSEKMVGEKQREELKNEDIRAKILNSSSPKSQKKPKALSKERTSGMFRRTA